MAGLTELRALVNEYRDCELCPRLCASRSSVVFGSGSASADIVLVGTAPGPAEEETGVPFSGPSGRLFNQLISRALNSERISELDSIEDDEVYHSRLRDILEEDIFFTNAVLCYPGEDKEPTASELRTCRKRLHHTIYLLDPRLVIAAGKTAATALVGKKVRVLERRGSLMDIAVESPVTGRSVRYPMLVLLDPGQIDRSGEKVLVGKKKGKAWQTIEDMKRALQFLKTYDTIAQRRES